MKKIYVLEYEGYQSATSNMWANGLARDFSYETASYNLKEKTTDKEFASILEGNDAGLLIISIENRKQIQKHLDLCRALRIPYIFLMHETPYNLKKVSMPITFLIEDKEKAVFASALGRFCNSEILVYSPKDYGDKAKETINQSKTLFDSFSLKYEIKNGKKGSSLIEKESAINAISDNSNMVIISASREYGLDDIIFGSKEKNIIRHTPVPIMLLNPRADLYALCD